MTNDLATSHEATASEQHHPPGITDRMLVYRAMDACSGSPCVGDMHLGVRVPQDIQPDGAGFVEPGLGGMSVTPNDPWDLPRHRRPPSLYGTGKRPVWEYSIAHLPSSLVLRLESVTHGLVEPGARMGITVYRSSLGSTAPDWRKIHE